MERGDAYVEAGALHSGARLGSGNMIAFLTRLGRGEFGLAKTYWFGWFLSDLAWLVPASIVAFIGYAAGPMVGASTLAILLAMYLAYNVLVMVGVWRAAGEYQGWRGWAVWAKLNIGLAGVGFVVAAGVLLLRLLLG